MMKMYIQLTFLWIRAGSFLWISKNSSPSAPRSHVNSLVLSATDQGRPEARISSASTAAWAALPFSLFAEPLAFLAAAAGDAVVVSDLARFFGALAGVTMSEKNLSSSWRLLNDSGVNGCSCKAGSTACKHLFGVLAGVAMFEKKLLLLLLWRLSNDGVVSECGGGGANKCSCKTGMIGCDRGVAFDGTIGGPNSG